MTRYSRDEFPVAVREALAKRASFLCSNPDCRCLTVAPADSDEKSWISIGCAAHITAAAPGGPRYDASLTPDQRKSVENGIFLCANCAEMIDKNGGADFPPGLLRAWKDTHEQWVRGNLNKGPTSAISVVDGTHTARGKGVVTGLDAEEPVIIKPGTRVSAEGEGNVTATRIGKGKRE